MDNENKELRMFFNTDATTAGRISPKIVDTASITDTVPLPINTANITGNKLPETTGAVKYDAGKTQWHLFPWDAAEEIIKVLEFGAGKYNPWNWAEADGFKYSRLFNSSMRHFIAWFWRKEDNDRETGISHLAHLGCNVMFLLHYVLNKGKFKTNDDRR